MDRVDAAATEWLYLVRSCLFLVDFMTTASPSNILMTSMPSIWRHTHGLNSKLLVSVKKISMRQELQADMIIVFYSGHFNTN